MRRFLVFGQLKMAWKWGVLSFATIMALIIPPPHRAGGEFNDGPMLFSVVGSDYVSPLMSSASAVQVLNVRLNSYARFAGYDQLRVLANWGGAPVFAMVTRYSGNLLALLQSEFLMKETNHRVTALGAQLQRAFISESFWKREFGAAPDVLGTILDFCGEKFRIAGIVRTGEALLSETEIWVPICARGSFTAATSLRVIGQMHHGADWRVGEKKFDSLIKRDRFLRERAIELDGIHFLPDDQNAILERRFHAAIGTGELPPDSSNG